MPDSIVFCAKSGDKLVALEDHVGPFGLSSWDFLRYSVMISFAFLIVVQGIVDILTLRDRRTYYRIIQRLASQESGDRS